MECLSIRETRSGSRKGRRPALEKPVAIRYNEAMGKKVYIDTTIVSYLTARPSRDLVIAAHQEATREFWPRLLSDLDPYISALVYGEASRGDPKQAEKRIEAIRPFPMLDIDDEVRALAEKIIDGKGVPDEYPEDALHVAVAAANGMDLLVTWNFAHINNPFTRPTIRQIIQGEGYPSPEICSPDELLEKDR